MEKKPPVNPAAALDGNEGRRKNERYCTFIGSVTRPPCPDNVLWMAWKQPMQASPAQMALFSRLVPLNARSIQASNGRMVKESN